MASPSPNNFGFSNGNLDKKTSSTSYYHSFPDIDSNSDKRWSSQPPPDEFEPPPKTTSNTYHQSQTGNNNWTLPPGWKVAHRETDGRMFYFELSTGKASWNHPSVPYQMPSQQSLGTQSLPESPMTASKRPDSHQCSAVFACIVFPPLGIFALIHSILTYVCWNKNQYGNAYDHSRQASNFASWSILIFVAFGIYHFFKDGVGFETLNFYQWYIRAFQP